MQSNYTKLTIWDTGTSNFRRDLVVLHGKPGENRSWLAVGKNNYVPVSVAKKRIKNTCRTGVAGSHSTLVSSSNATDKKPMYEMPLPYVFGDIWRAN